MDKWVKKAKDYRDVQVYQLHENATLGDCLNFGVMKSNYDFIAKFDDDDYYGPSYISSAMNAFKDNKVSVVGKSSYYIYFRNRKALIHVKGTENSITDTVAGATLLFRKDVFYHIRFEKVDCAEDYLFIKDAKKAGFVIYSTDHHDFAVIRQDSEKHTWKISDKDLMKWGKLIAYTDEIQSIVLKE